MNIHPLWFLCVLFRFSLIFIIRYVYNMKKFKFNKLLPCIILLIISIGFIYKGLFGSNKENQFAKVFWHETRIIHGFFYLLACYYLFIDKLYLNSTFLLIDLLFSISYRFFNKI
jgi:hypothetical protein